MKVQVAAVIGAIVALQSVEAYQCNPGNIFERDPVDCRAFYQCDPNSGSVWRQTCPGDSVFNTKYNICDHRENVDCTPLVQTSEAPKAVQVAASAGAVCDVDHIFRVDTEDCHSFYQCDPNSGSVWKLTCPDGGAFNPKYNVCDHPENVDGCKKKSLRSL